MKRTCTVLMALALMGCASTKPDAHAPAAAAEGAEATAAPAAAEAGARPGRSRLAGDMGAAVVSPLSDLNLLRTDIPALLQAARQAPYALPAERGCAALAEDIAALDELLGADLDAPATAERPSLLERGTDEAGALAVKTVQGAVSDAIPFRGWLRRLTGAERHARHVAAAITAGGVRRAFLKGLARAQDCAPQAVEAAATGTPEPAQAPMAGALAATEPAPR